jgi:hypothetical protein
MPALSPRTQQMQAGMDAGPDQETALFEQGFSDMAYALLSSRMPDVVADVVTFKVLDVDIDKGSGVGAFVVLRGEAPIYVPVVMADNAIKPLEIFYHKKLNVFLPLTKGWLDEIDKTSLSSLGTGVKTPETLYTDVDIRNVVVPPITGRFSYAAWMPKALVDVARVCSLANLEAATKVAAEGAVLLLDVLDRAPNAIKTAFAAFLKKNPRTLKQAAEVYGVTALQRALAPRLEKVAAKQLHGGALWIADADNTPTDFKRIFGDRAAEAYAGVKKKGFAARDERLNRNMAVQDQPYERWVEPKQPGVYVLFASDGSEKPAFVMCNPIDIFDEGTRYGRRPAIPGHNPIVDNSYYDPSPHGSANKVYPMGRPDESDYVLRRGYGAKPYLAVFGDGSYIEPMKLVGRDSIADEVAGKLHQRMFESVDGAPRVGKGFFVRQKGTTFQATTPIEIKSMSTGSDGVRRLRVTNDIGYPERTIATDPTHPYGTIWMPKGADIVYLPPDFVWIPLGERKNTKGWFTSAHDLQACVSSMLSAVGAKKVAIKDAQARQYSIDGSLPMSRVAALKKLAHEHVLPVDDVDALLEKAAADKSVTVWVASPAQLARLQATFDKLAADDDKGGDKKKADSGDKPKKKSPPPGGGGGGAPDAGGDPGMDPSMGEQAAMAAMAPPAPPPPAPLDLAAMEMDQAIQHEMQKLMERSQTIQQLLARSHEIGGGAPVAPMVQTQAMGAPPPSMNLATGGPPTMGASPMGPQPGMDPSMGAAVPPGMPPGGPFPPAANDPSMMGGMGGGMPPGGDPSMMGGAPGMDPSMGGGMPPGGDPSMMGGMGGASGMDPSMGGGMQQPQHAMMPPDGPNAMALPQEVNPQFLDQAAALHSADMFDAAAVATLAQSPALHGVVAQCLPNLEKTIDNLARVRLTLWMQESDLKPQIGEQTFAELDENLQSTFKGLGDLVLRLTRGVQAVKEPDASAP